MVVKFASASEASNKPNKPHWKKVAYGYGEGYIALIPQIDRLSLTYKVPPSHFGPIKGNLTDAVNLPWKNLSANKLYSYRRELVHAETGAKVLIEAAPKKPTISFLRMDFNPGKLGIEGVEFLKEKLFEIVFDEHPWSKIAANCSVTRLDIAADLLGVNMNRLLVSDYKSGSGKGKPLVRGFYVSSEGALETVYFGRKPPKLRVYNKAKQLADEKLVPVYGDTSHVRIEMITEPKRPITKLIGIENPFEKIVIRHLGDVEPPDGAYNWTFFLDSCRLRGAKSALALLPTEELRQAYANALTEAEKPTWKPAVLWAKWPNVLKGSGLLPE